MKRNTTSKKYPLLITHLLLEKNLKKEEILKTFNIKDGTFYKNIQSIKNAGFYLKKSSEQKYAIEYFKNKFNLNHNETSLLAYFLTMGTIFLPKYKTKTLKETIKKILLLTNLNTFSETAQKYDYYKKINFNKLYKEKIETIDEMIEEKKPIIIVTKSKKEFVLKPLGFIWNDDKIYVNFINENKLTYKKILIDCIVKITPLDKKPYTPQGKETLFQLFGKLANSYLLKEEERIVDTDKGSITVANSSAEKKELYKRLLRYENLCKIVFPKSDTNDFKQMLIESVRNLERNDTRFD